MREELSPSKKVCLLWRLEKHSPFRLQLFTAETVTISITIYKEKIKTIFELSSPFFQNHFTASGSPVDFILPNFSPFLPFNRVNLWYFAIFFLFLLFQVHPTVTVKLLLKRDSDKAVYFLLRTVEISNTASYFSKRTIYVSQSDISHLIKI